MSCATAIARHNADPVPTPVARGAHRPGPVRGARAAQAAAPVRATPVKAGPVKVMTIPVGAPAEASEAGHILSRTPKASREWWAPR
jgi:hypothetical protein